MKFKVLWHIAQYLYSNVLRDILKKAIDDPKQEWDDVILHICDSIFDYQPKS